MPKPEIIYTCTKCDAQTSKWSGRCLACGAWGTLGEALLMEKPKNDKSRLPSKAGELQSFATQTTAEAKLSSTTLPYLDQVLGGGLVAGSVTLLAGEPGIGKSTILAQAALGLAQNEAQIVYVTGEESPAQIQRRLSRLTSTIPSSFLFLNETDTDIIAATLESHKPHLVIVDSIQSLTTNAQQGEAGSVGQVKASAAILTGVAKSLSIPIILVGQVTKDGDVAGPRVLEHLVDTVLFLEGDHAYRYRILRVLKHRFGSTDETALLSMNERGLELVIDPSSELLRDRATGVAGSAVTCLIEGHRAILIELQALITHAGYGTPVRRVTGVDSARLGMLLAVLSRRGGMQATDKDVYANAAGGIDARDPSVDLALVMAIGSALKDRPLDPTLGVCGELGLGGEVRPVSLLELRIKEFVRMGFTTLIVPKGQLKQTPKDVTMHEVKTLREALDIALTR